MPDKANLLDILEEHKAGRLLSNFVEESAAPV